MTRVSKGPDVRRSELVDAAKRLFFSKGYEKTSIRDIVDDVGVAKGLFYYYFDSKQAALDAVAVDMTAQAFEVMQPIVDDPALTAIEKWQQSVAVTSQWKLARKQDMLALAHVLLSSDNVQLLSRLVDLMLAKLTPLYARMIEQGVQEGVFDVESAVISAELVLAMTLSNRNIMFDVLMNPHHYDDAAQQIMLRLRTVQTATERVLGAAPGSLRTTVIDEETLRSWFD